jgi:hypothetical protein
VKAKKHEENRRCADVTPNVRAEKKAQYFHWNNADLQD